TYSLIWKFDHVAQCATWLHSFLMLGSSKNSRRDACTDGFANATQFGGSPNLVCSNTSKELLMMHAYFSRGIWIRLGFDSLEHLFQLFFYFLLGKQGISKVNVLNHHTKIVLSKVAVLEHVVVA